jgi:replication-associated recombination protein RarA
MGYDLRTQRGYDFYLVSSSLQKAIRRGDVRLAGYFALELFPQYSEYCWKRLLTVSAEDCYGVITKEIMALYEGFKVVNKGKSKEKMGGRIFISKAVILLCTQPHSRDADVLSNFVYDRKRGLTDEQIEAYMEEARKDNTPIPDYAYDVHTRQGKMKGKTKADFFVEEDQSLAYRQLSIFDDINIGVM